MARDEARRATDACVRRWVDRKHRISAALGAAPLLSAYGASKHAVIGLTKTAAIELAPDGIRVNAICPGPIMTNMIEEAERGYEPEDPAVARAAFTARTPLARYGEATEVAQVARFCSARLRPM